MLPCSLLRYYYHIPPLTETKIQKPALSVSLVAAYMPSVLTANHHSHGYRDKKQKPALSVSLVAAYMPSVLTANHHSQRQKNKNQR